MAMDVVSYPFTKYHRINMLQNVFGMIIFCSGDRSSISRFVGSTTMEVEMPAQKSRAKSAKSAGTRAKTATKKAAKGKAKAKKAPAKKAGAKKKVAKKAPAKKKAGAKAGAKKAAKAPAKKSTGMMGGAT
jgi:hypothetical protein